ncbi:hypothetical protein CLV78_101768 [Aliiruegeria haliotis]|uniref:Uncharacterized protein n=1 Tax=Aliiruegeria haliotis TaxID=1280846 RepID=A0A2T0RZQ9_9RHOB|nr:hypothetical protein [Aliiruegeria haliotis]PRY26667.1 hypothetical protein CLV78_101768 [Aliiruegeria haliotis]
MVLSAAAQNLLRILIASYFLAGAIGVIPGSDLTPLTERIFSETLAGPVSASIVFVLAYMVMIGMWLRGAALLLGILTFWSSYLKMIDLGMADQLGHFWRDLALIASLILTYAETDPRNHHKRGVLRRGLQPRRVHPRVHAAGADGDLRVRRPMQEQNGPETVNATPADGNGHLRKPVSIEELETIFREEFEIARSN